MIRFLAYKTLIFFCGIFASIVTQAGVESTATLPQGIVSPEFMFGVINGLSEKYDGNGNVIGVTDQYHLNLTGQSLAKFYLPAAELVRTLNNFSATEKLGDSLSLGTVDFKANPSVTYFVINPAYGVSKKVAVGFAFPMIHFKNEMQIVTGGTSNVQSIQTYTSGVNPEVQAALNQAASISNSLPLKVQEVLASKGYKPVQDQDYSAPGDTQLYLRYRYFENKKIRMAVRPYFLLPSGRQDDPDDLTDYATGGVSGFGTYFTEEWQVHRIFTASLITQYEAHFQDRVPKRTPINADDFLPGLDRREDVNRMMGNLLDVTVAGRVQVKRWMDFGAFYDFATKDPDWYSGSREGYNYSLLSRDTGYQTHKVGAFIDFSTTQAYFDKAFKVPFVLGYTFSNVISAQNSLKTVSHVFNLRMFF